jgi:hypothetical protein
MINYAQNGNRSLYFTFSERWIMIHIHERGQKDKHFILNNLFHLNYPLYTYIHLKKPPDASN